MARCKASSVKTSFATTCKSWLFILGSKDRLSGHAEDDHDALPEMTQLRERLNAATDL